MHDLYQAYYDAHVAAGMNGPFNQYTHVGALLGPQGKDQRHSRRIAEVQGRRGLAGGALEGRLRFPATGGEAAGE